MPWRPAKIVIPILPQTGQPDFTQAEHVINQLFRETNGRIDDLSKTSQRRVQGGAVLDFGTIAPGSSVERTLHVTAVHTNLVAHANPVGDPGAGLIWSPRVTGTNQVTIRLSNPTAAPIAVNSITWKVVAS